MGQVRHGSATEWTIVGTLLPGSNRLGRPRTVDLRRVWNAIQYIAAAGCANIQEREGAPGVFAKLRREAARLRHVFAYGGYAGPKLRGALVSLGRWNLQIVNRSDTAKGFEVLPRRCLVERTFAWLGCCRRLARDWEKTIDSAEAWGLIAHIR